MKIFIPNLQEILKCKMRLGKSLFCLAILLFSVCFLSKGAQRPYFYKYGSISGLPNNSIISCMADSDGFVWLGTKDGLYRFDGNSFMVPDALQGSPLLKGTIGAICEDSEGKIWFSSGEGVGNYNRETGEVSEIEGLSKVACFSIAADASGIVWIVDYRTSDLYRFNTKDGELRLFPASKYIAANRVYVDKNGTAWFTVSGKGSVYTYNVRSDRFDKVALIVDGKENEDPLNFIQGAGDDQIILSTTRDKLFRINTVTNKAELIHQIQSKYAEIRCILHKSGEEYWIGTSDGLTIVKNGKASVIRHSDNDSHTISGDDLWSMSMDKDGNIWIGTLYNGLNLWRNNLEIAHSFYEEADSETSLKGKLVRAISPDTAGNIWIGTEDGGFNKLNLTTNEIKSYSIHNDIGERINIQSLVVQGNMVWISSFADGIFVFDTEEEKVVRNYTEPTRNYSNIYLTPDNKILVGSRRIGLLSYDPNRDIFDIDEQVGDGYIHDILVDSNNGVWIGTYGYGIRYHDKATNNVFTFTTKDGGKGLTSDYVTSLFEDSKHRIWITTEGGGVCIIHMEDVAKGEFNFEHLSTDHGLTTNVTSAVTEDPDGNIWITTSRGIMLVDKDELFVKEVLFINGDILGDQYAYDACYTTRSGIIFLGTTQGLLQFNPKKNERLMETAPLYITELTAATKDNRHYIHSEGKSTLNSDVIKVKSKDITSLRIRYTLNSFALPQSVLYKYSIKKGRHVTSSTTTESYVRFTDMHPGKYEFSINVMGLEDKRPDKKLTLIIQPPLLQSVFAKIMYLLLASAIMGFGIWRILKNRDAKRQYQIKQIEDEKQKEISKAKINFFTNITHELRTPLTLIKLPLDKIISEKDYTPSSKNDLLTIQANTNRILSLTNQLLDMRKMDAKEEKLRYVKKDICEIVRNSCSYFSQAAKDQHITITQTYLVDPIVIPCAEDTVSTIVNNLMSNAFKYGKDRVDVFVDRNNGVVSVRVNSNGKRIPTEESENIFKLFYQLDNSDNVQRSNGTGLGLSYARSMAKLHNGKLYLDTSVKDCNSFVLELPTIQEENLDMGRESESISEIEMRDDWDSSRHYILVVEDDTEMRNYIGNELSDEYNIMSAANGAEAMEIIQNQRIDLVLSDIMMPVMDGYQLCNTIKMHSEYSHIPVILLTAAVGMETKMKTLEEGADGYIEKPFAMNLLRANISNLFKNREIAYHQFVNSPLTHFNSVTVCNVDKEYMDQLHDVILNHLSDHNLNVDLITEKLGSSKSTIYRKVKANTGLNINEYIRVCRLKQAAEMLSSMKYRVNEVAYLVGFSSPSYFATSFQKQFDVSPSNFVKKLGGKDDDEDLNGGNES